MSSVSKPEPRSESPFSILVVGYGNELRGDDGAGAAVARSIEIAHLPDVTVRIVHQLMPELADDLLTCSRVIFVDAAYPPGGSLRVERLQTTTAPAPKGTSSQTPTLGHVARPEELLRLAEALQGRAPEAWWIGVPTQSFELGAPFSATTLQGILDAVQEIARLCVPVRSTP